MEVSMGQRFAEISQPQMEFIAAQKMFFVATAPEQGHVNLSPKGLDSLRVLGPRRVLWLNLTGSGNETAAHVLDDPRMTVMFCAFEGAPMILRLYGQARVIHRGDADWAELSAHFPPLPGARQLFDLDVELVQTSCGMGVPYFDPREPREQLLDWARKQGEAGVRDYWSRKNQTSLDGLPTRILERSGDA
jgi:hypothetical protein